MLTIGALNFDYGDKVVAGFSNIGNWTLMFCTWRKIYATQMTLKYLQELQYFSNVADVAIILYYPNRK
jgi:hypothetical protein